MNRVIILVFPTLWSPKNTSLYFASGAKDAVAGRACPDTTEARDMTEDEEDVAVGRETALVSAVAPILPLAGPEVLVAPVGA